MKISGLESNNELLDEIGKRIKRQRIDLGFTQEQLAIKSGVSVRTIVNIENGQDVKLSILLNVLRAENMLTNIDLLIPEVLIRPYDYLKLKKQKQRVRKKTKQDRNEFKWGDENE